MSCLAKLALFLGALALLACGSESAPGSQGVARVSSVKGAFSATFTPEPNPPVTGENALAITLESAPGVGVVGASLGVEPWMPAHGHGSSTEPVVSELGDGEYRAEQIHYMMPGRWELKIEVEAGETHDSFVVGFDVK